MKRGVEFDNNKDIWALISEANQLISMIILRRVQGCFHWCKKVGSVSVWPLQNLPRNWYKLIKIAREYKKGSIDQFNFNPCQFSYVHEYQMWSVMFTRSFESNHIRIEKDGWHSIPYVWKGNAERMIRGLSDQKCYESLPWCGNADWGWSGNILCLFLLFWTWGFPFFWRNVAKDSNSRSSVTWRCFSA